MKTMKKIYLPATFEIISLTVGDMLTSSGGCDGTDNWADDIFSGAHL